MCSFFFAPSMFSLPHTFDTCEPNKLYIPMDQYLANQSLLLFTAFCVFFGGGGCCRRFCFKPLFNYIKNTSAKKLSCLNFLELSLVCVLACSCVFVHSVVMCECKSIKSRRKNEKSAFASAAAKLPYGMRNSRFSSFRYDLISILIVAFMQMRDFTI